MARTVAGLREGTRVTDYISLGVVAKAFPLDRIHSILKETGRETARHRRHRQLPAHVVFYYVIALALFSNVSYGEVLRCLVEGLGWLGDDSLRRIRCSGRSAISRARARLGAAPLRRMIEVDVMPIPTCADRALALTPSGPTIFATIRVLNFSECIMLTFASVPPVRGR